MFLLINSRSVLGPKWDNKRRSYQKPRYFANSHCKEHFFKEIIVSNNFSLALSRVKTTACGSPNSRDGKEWSVAYHPSEEQTKGIIWKRALSSLSGLRQRGKVSQFFYTDELILNAKERHTHD